MKAQKEVAEAVRRYRDDAYRNYSNARGQEAKDKNYKKYVDLEFVFAKLQKGDWKVVDENGNAVGKVGF